MPTPLNFNGSHTVCAFWDLGGPSRLLEAPGTSAQLLLSLTQRPDLDGASWQGPEMRPEFPACWPRIQRPLSGSSLCSEAVLYAASCKTLLEDNTPGMQILYCFNALNTRIIHYDAAQRVPAHFKLKTRRVCNWPPFKLLLSTPRKNSCQCHCPQALRSSRQCTCTAPMHVHHKAEKANSLKPAVVGHV